jgi:hypothetical protein
MDSSSTFCLRGTHLIGCGGGSSGPVATLAAPNSVTIYAAGANGNVAPIRTIYGSETDLYDPAGVALGVSGAVYVTNAGAGGGLLASVTVYVAGVNGKVPPIRTISGSKTDLSPRGIVVR